jgi:hypothetical protein
MKIGFFSGKYPNFFSKPLIFEKKIREKQKEYFPLKIIRFLKIQKIIREKKRGIL